MYDLSELEEDEKQIISIFSVLPNERISFHDFEQFAQKENIQTPLLSVAKKGWIDYNAEDKSFKVNQVVQDIVNVKHQNRLLKDCVAMINFFANVIQNTDNLFKKEDYAISQFLIRYAESIVAALIIPNADLGRLCQNIGNFYTASGDLSKVLKSTQEMRDIFEDLSSAQPDNVSFKNGLAISYINIALINEKKNNTETAITIYKKAEHLWLELTKDAPAYASFKNHLDWVKAQITHLKS